MTTAAKRLLLLPGDGVGPEALAAAKGLLEAVRLRLRERKGPELTWSEGLVGGAAIDREGTPLPQETIDEARAADAVLLGAVGGPRWDALPPGTRPEAGLLGLRKALSVYANLRPAVLLPGLESLSPLRAKALEGLDCLVVRELTGGLYYGQPRGRSNVDGERQAVDTMLYRESEIRRIAHVAFRAARGRRRHVTSVDKANVLENSRLWRDVVEEVAKEYPDVTLAHQLIDSMAMLLVLHPGRYDVVLAENLFGDILSDEMGGVVGTLGVLASASLGDGGPGLYEPVHGSAPDIAGQDVANPLGTILSVGMLLEYSLGLPDYAQAVRGAVNTVLRKGYRTQDLLTGAAGEETVGTRALGRLIAEEFENAS